MWPKRENISTNTYKETNPPLWSFQPSKYSQLTNAKTFPLPKHLTTAPTSSIKFCIETFLSNARWSSTTPSIWTKYSTLKAPTENSRSLLIWSVLLMPCSSRNLSRQCTFCKTRKESCPIWTNLWKVIWMLGLIIGWSMGLRAVEKPLWLSSYRLNTDSNSFNTNLTLPESNKSCWLLKMDSRYL